MYEEPTLLFNLRVEIDSISYSNLMLIILLCLFIEINNFFMVINNTNNK